MSEWRFWFNSQRGTLLALAIFLAMFAIYLVNHPAIVNNGRIASPLIVRWPNGTTEEFPGTTAGDLVRLVEGSGKSVPVPMPK